MSLTVETASLPLSAPHRRNRVRALIGRVGTRPALAAAATVLVVSGVVLIAAHHSPSLAIPRARAIASVGKSPLTRPLLKGIHWTQAKVVAIDGSHDSVWFYDGPRLRLSAIVGAGGTVQYESDTATQGYAYGSNIANSPVVLALLSIVFVLMTAVWPLGRLRNLDVLAIAASTAAIVLLNEALIDRMALVGSAVLLYLWLRCAWVALGPQRAAPRATPLFDRITHRLDDRRRVRTLRLLALTAGLIVAMLGISSLRVVDVGWAVMEGATDIVHGVLPYGHIAGILHGDTYPIGSYLLYTPAAWLSPVRDTWDSADAALFVTVLAVVAAAGALWRQTGSGRASGDERPHESATLRAAIAWLTFPALLVTVSTGSTDAVLAAILLAAILLWKRPTAAGAVVAAGAWFKLIPIVLVPLVLAPLRGRRLVGAILAVLVVSAVALVPLVALGGPGAFATMAHAVGYQAVRASPQSLWALTGSVPLQQLVQAATLAMVAGATVRLWRAPGLAADRTRIAALCAALVIGLQLSASYWTYMYFSWALPGLMLSLLWADPAREGA